MKRKLFCFLLMALMLTGCGQGSAFPPDGASEPPAAWSEAAAPAAGMTSSQLERAPRPLPEEEIRTAYDRAVTIYSWFTVDLLPDSGETAEIDGCIYRKVDRQGIADLDDLRAFLRSVFSRDLTERLLATGGGWPLYQELDGVLYVRGESRPRDDRKGGIEVQVQQIDDVSYSVNVTVDLLDENGESAGLECWSFPYAYEDDRWVFLEFQLVY